MRIPSEKSEELDASPSKRIFLSIISDYDLNKSLCELIDNALDAHRNNRLQTPLKVHLKLDAEQQSIELTDNAGGVKREDLRLIVSPGESRNTASDDTIGYFGVGSKRSVVALAQQIKITTRAATKDPGYRIVIDDEWLQSSDWTLPTTPVSSFPPGTTCIDLSKLRIKLDSTNIQEVATHIGETYGRFIKSGRLEVKLNNDPVGPVFFEEWAYPPEHPPHHATFSLPLADGGTIGVDIIGGLTVHSNPSEYGAFIYCNDRLIGKGLTSPEVGFALGAAGRPHPALALARVIVSLKGPASEMPWNSSKSDINSKHHVFRALREHLVETMKHWTSLSRRWEGDWSTKVSPHATGSVFTVPGAALEKAPRSYLPKLPTRSRTPYLERVKRENLALRDQKPWIAGLCDSMMAVSLVGRDKRIEQKNRICIVLLDSTLEIAFKEYLVNESGQHYSDRQLVQLFSNRKDVQDEIKKTVRFSDATWKKISHFYGLRCKLVHERASTGVADEQVSSYRHVVEMALRKMFGIRFPPEGELAV